MSSQLPDLMTYRECADYLKVSVYAVMTWAQHGVIPCIRLSRRCVRFDKAQVAAWLAARNTDKEAANG